MKILVLNGSPKRDKSDTEAARQEIRFPHDPGGTIRGHRKRRGLRVWRRNG